MNFFVLAPVEHLFGTRFAYAEIEDPMNFGDAEHCPQCNRSIGPLEWLSPHYIRLSSFHPIKWGDFLWRAGFQLMVSKRFRNFYETTGDKGIKKFYPSAIIKKAGTKLASSIHNIPIYHSVKLARDGATISDTLSNVQRRGKPCSFCRLNSLISIHGAVFEANSWTGNHIFKAKGLPGTIFVTEEFCSWILKFNFTNVRCIPARRYAYEELKGSYDMDNPPKLT